MARVYSLLSTKGGCGKSTASVSLAAHYASLGMRVLLIDADGPQHHAAKWLDGAEALSAIKCVVEPHDVAPIIAEHDADYDRILVDVIGVDADVLSSAASNSDLVAVPMACTPLDADGALSTARRLIALEQEMRADLTKKGDPAAATFRIPFRILLTRVQPRTRLYRHYKHEIVEAGFPLLRTEWKALSVYAEGMAFGSTPTFLEPKGEAAQQIADLAAELDSIVDAMQSKEIA